MFSYVYGIRIFKINSVLLQVHYFCNYFDPCGHFEMVFVSDASFDSVHINGPGT